MGLEQGLQPSLTRLCLSLPARTWMFRGASGIHRHTPQRKAALLSRTHAGFLSHPQLTPRAGDLGVFPEKSLFHATPSPS